MGVEIASFQNFLVDLHLFAQFQAIGDLDLNNPVQDSLIGMVRFELIPFRFVGMRQDDAIKVNHGSFAGGWYGLLLGGGYNGMQVFHIVLEYLNKLHQAAVAHVKGSIQR